MADYDDDLDSQGKMLAQADAGGGTRPNQRLETANTLLQDRRVRAFLGALAQGESAGRYNAIVGGGTFQDYSQHPNIYVPKYDSTEAGAYQFNNGTWKEQASALGLTDFAPYSQDLAAVDLLRRLGSIQKLNSGDLEGAVFSAARRWESLPAEESGSSRLGAKRSLENFKNEYYSRLY